MKRLPFTGNEIGVCVCMREVENRMDLNWMSHTILTLWILDIQSNIFRMWDMKFYKKPTKI